MKRIPYGYCHCGCGGKTRLATQSRTARGHVKGHPLPYINNHWVRGNQYSKGNTVARDNAKLRKPEPVFLVQDGEPCVNIPLTKGKWALVSQASYHKVKEYSWLYSQGFACRTIGYSKRKERMHRTIAGVSKGQHVGHRNGDPLDNRDRNLIYRK